MTTSTKPFSIFAIATLATLATIGLAAAEGSNCTTSATPKCTKYITEGLKVVGCAEWKCVELGGGKNTASRATAGNRNIFRR